MNGRQVAVTRFAVALASLVTVASLTGCKSGPKVGYGAKWWPFKKGKIVDLTNPAAVRARRPLLIAHRGGVVTAQAPECSLAAIRLAAAHGYDMVELDIQEAQDKQPVIFHDERMLEACGIDQAIRDLASRELTRIYFRGTGERIVHLADALALCKSLNLGVMLDIKTFKDQPESEEFFKTIAQLLDKHGFAHATVMLGQHPMAMKHLTGKTLIMVSKQELDRVMRGESVPLHEKFWFGIPQRLPEGAIKPLQRNGALVIPAINTFRYPAENHLELARQDIERLLAEGVEGFQIDSVYEGNFRRK